MFQGCGLSGGVCLWNRGLYVIFSGYEFIKFMPGGPAGPGEPVSPWEPACVCSILISLLLHVH